MVSIDLPRSGAPRVSVIIPATSTRHLLLSCLRSLARFGPSQIAYETIVVLNESDQDAESQLRDTVSGLQVVGSPVNLGLAGAGNFGRSLARGEFLVLLHDDAEVEPEWLEALVDTVDAHPEAGAAGGKVLFPDGSLQSAGMILWRNANTSPPWVGETPEPGAFDRLRAVDYCGTSSLVVRAAVWDAIGGLDERFYPVYYVDVDLSMAVRRLGMVVLYQPHSCIRHQGGGSSSPQFRSFVHNRNRMLFLQKWAEALEEHEPQEDSRAALERALARTEALAERSCGLAPISLSPARAPFDPVLHQLRHLKKSCALQNDYLTFLHEILKTNIAGRMLSCLRTSRIEGPRALEHKLLS